MPVDGMSAYKRPLNKEDKARYDANWDNIFLVKEKKCGRCKMIKKYDEFGKNKSEKTGLKSYCHQCESIVRREFYQKNPGKMKEQRKKRYMESPDMYHWRNIQSKYGISEIEYNIMLNNQNNVCAICGEKRNFKQNDRLCVDHCHKKNVVRGLLCGRCNMLLGCADDKIYILENAIKYLKKNEESKEEKTENVSPG
jgi:hypothetical protein